MFLSIILNDALDAVFVFTNFPTQLDILYLPVFCFDHALTIAIFYITWFCAFTYLWVQKLYSFNLVIYLS